MASPSFFIQMLSTGQFDSLCNDGESFPNLPKDDFQNLLMITSKEWILKLNNAITKLMVWLRILL